MRTANMHNNLAAWYYGFFNRWPSAPLTYLTVDKRTAVLTIILTPRGHK